MQASRICRVISFFWQNSVLAVLQPVAKEGAVEFEWGNKYARPSRYCDHSYVRIPRRLLSPRADLYRGITAAGHASAVEIGRIGFVIRGQLFLGR
jgi:hypothetical protein